MPVSRPIALAVAGLTLCVPATVNALVESFFGTLQLELLDRRRWATRRQLAQAIFEYIEVFYNRQRRHSYLGYLSPVEFEELASSAEAVA